jgi:uncharacterized OB-fold protein
MTDRPLPQPDDETAFFWDGAREGLLLILHCDACDWWVHYPKPACPKCGGPLEPKPTSGRGVVHTFTVTHASAAGFTPPFGVVLVELEEQKGLRVVSNLLGVAPDEIRIGMPVEVTFETFAEDVALPLFKVRDA